MQHGFPRLLESPLVMYSISRGYIVIIATESQRFGIYGLILVNDCMVHDGNK